MRRCCEETMRVLRDNHEALLILIEVPTSQASWSCVHRTSSALPPALPCALVAVGRAQAGEVCCSTDVPASSGALPAGRQVFIHDPLYKWAMTPAKAQQRQLAEEDAEAAGANAGAVCCLIRVRPYDLSLGSSSVLHQSAAGSMSIASAAHLQATSPRPVAARSWRTPTLSVPWSASSRSCRAWREVRGVQRQRFLS